MGVWLGLALKLGLNCDNTEDTKYPEPKGSCEVHQTFDKAKSNQQHYQIKQNMMNLVGWRSYMNNSPDGMLPDAAMPPKAYD
jgi:hypothetical protein